MSVIISTVILIAISITMAIAVAFWAMGVGNSFTKFEKLEFVSVYADTSTAQATAAANVNSSGSVTSISLTSGGSGYTSIPSVIITGAGGTGATARTVLTNGVVTSVIMISVGSGYPIVGTTVTIVAPSSSVRFPIYIQLKNTGTAAATINNLFLDGKPYNVVGATTNLVSSSTTQSVVLQVGQRRNDFYIYLPLGTTWNSGEYVEIEIQTSAGRLYSNTVMLP